jgi:diguanylate cyclase (GGDEF)-like protein
MVFEERGRTRGTTPGTTPRPKRSRAGGDGPLTSLVAERIISLLGEGLDVDGWRANIGELEQKWGAECYSAVLFVLTHLDFTPRSAKQHWTGVLDQWTKLSKALREDVDLPVAALHYFLRIQRKLRNPAIVEIKILKKTQDSATRDELTHLRNFRYFRERIQDEIKRVHRYSAPLCLLMVDADDFKAYNDARGHLAGNVALRRLARAVARSVREVDIVARYGGEEFAVLLPNTPKLAALQVAEKVRRTVEEAGIGGEAGSPRPLTVSIGIAGAPGDAADADGLIEMADRALYVAKSLGKNRVRAFSDERRERARMNASLPGSFSLLARQAYPLTTSNLSDGGLGFTSKEPVVLGSLAQVRLSLPPPAEPVDCLIRVARVIEQGGAYEIGARIIEMERLHERRYRSFVARLRADGLGAGS